MELTGHVKPAPKPESVRTYTPEEEDTFVSMVNDGAFVEEIAEALELPPIKLHCSVLAEDSIKKAIEDWEKKKEHRQHNYYV